MFDSFQDFWTWGDGILRSLALALITCAAFWVVGSILHRKVAPAIIAHSDGKRHPIFLQLFKGFSHPINIFLKIMGICFGLLILSQQLENEYLPTAVMRILEMTPPVVYRAIRVSVVLMIAWGLVGSSDISAMLIKNARNKLDLHMSKGVARFLSAVSNVVVVLIAAAILFKEFGYDINGIVAGLGLGGLTIALAAQESASNFFGGLVLIMEKPFEIGDWIVCDNVEGTVEDINLRSTKVRTAAGSLTVVPNAKLSSSPITNWGGGMERRRADFTLNLEYTTTRQQIREFTESVRTMLETDPEIITDSVLVRFSDLADSSLGIKVQFFTSMPGFADHMQVRERVNLALLDIAERHDVAYAFPTRTVHVETTPVETKPKVDKIN